MQFGITETEKGPWRERRHERGKNKSYDANATAAQRGAVKILQTLFLAGKSYTS